MNNPEDTGRKGIDALLAQLDRHRQIVIQAHDFPDHDAVAAGYALVVLLEDRGLKPLLCFSGRIQSLSLSEAIRLLDIPIKPASEIHIEQDAQIILVDGFVGNRNVSGLPGKVVGLIDHHSPPVRPNVPYWDIRVEYGSCSTILFSYFKKAGVTVPRNCATSLLMGLMMDTAFMTRGVNGPDLEAFSELFFQGDWQLGSRLLKNSLSLADLAVFREAMNVCQVAQDFCFIPLQKECSPEVAALTADFFLTIREIHFVVVLVPDREEYRLSVRSEDTSKPADVIIRGALKSIGSGGGHVHMGGGQISHELFPGEQGLRQRFLQELQKLQSPGQNMHT
jgi:nanoRNase/pAp phosphatase (c-di-AMP/oligoRNAs hydrolase)